MSADIRKLVAAEPFVPFAIHTADGGVLHYEVLSPLLVARLSVESGASAASPNT